MPIRGRPEGWILDPNSHDAPVAQEECVLDKPRGRLTLPYELIAPLTWITTSAPMTVLAVLEEAGRVRLLGWAPHGEGVVAKRRELVEVASGDSGKLEALRQLEERYCRLTIERNRRLPLPDRVRGHLDAAPGDKVHVVRLEQELEVWSAEYRARRSSEPSEDIADLP